MNPPAPLATKSKIGDLLGSLVRIFIPAGLLGVGVWGFTVLSVEPEETKSDEKPKQMLRTSVTKLSRTDYPVVVQTNGIVSPHNEVTLSAQVSGQVIRVSPGFEVGAYFSEGDVLVELDSSDYRTAVDVAAADQLGAQSANELAQQTYDRMVKLYRTNNVSEAEMHQAEAELKQSAAQLDAATAALERAKRDLKRTKVIAPFDGRVREKTVGVGQAIGPGAPLGLAFSVDFAEVRLPISAKELAFLDLPELSEDAAVEVQLQNGIDETSDITWRGKIVRTEGALDANSLELFVIARIDDPFGLQSGNPPLRIGQPVRGSIKGKVLKDVIAIPRLAVRQLDRIFLVDEQELTMSSKTIEPLWSDEQFMIVRDSGIGTDALLSTTQLVYVPEGAQVEIIPEVELTATTASVTASDKTAPVTN